jgi:hypothetical protein
LPWTDYHARLPVAALTREEKLTYQREIKALESARNARRKSFFEAQDDAGL